VIAHDLLAVDVRRGESGIADSIGIETPRQDIGQGQRTNAFEMLM